MKTFAFCLVFLLLSNVSWAGAVHDIEIDFEFKTLSGVVYEQRGEFIARVTNHGPDALDLDETGFSVIARVETTGPDASPLIQFINGPHAHENCVISGFAADPPPFVDPFWDFRIGVRQFQVIEAGETVSCHGIFGAGLYGEEGLEVTWNTFISNLSDAVDPNDENNEQTITFGRLPDVDTVFVGSYQDPLGDALGFFPTHDVTGLSAYRFDDYLEITLDYVFTPLLDSPNGNNILEDQLYAFIELDTDLDTSTGFETRPRAYSLACAPSVSFGVDYQLWFDKYDQTIVLSTDYFSSIIADESEIPIEFNDGQVVIQLPLDLIGSPNNEIELLVLSVGQDNSGEFFDYPADCTPDAGKLRSAPQGVQPLLPPVAVPSLSFMPLLLLCLLVLALAKLSYQKRQRGSWPSGK